MANCSTGTFRSGWQTLCTENCDPIRLSLLYFKYLVVKENILFVLPLSAIVVGNAGWIGKAISISSPAIISPNTSPDQIFVVVANIIASPGMFGFIMAALTAALMSTVDTLINATAAIFINDVYRPVQKFLKKAIPTKSEKERRELGAARYASIGVTVLGVLAVLAFKNFPSLLLIKTPVAICSKRFWKSSWEA